MTKFTIFEVTVWLDFKKFKDKNYINDLRIIEPKLSFSYIYDKFWIMCLMWQFIISCDLKLKK